MWAIQCGHEQVVRELLVKRGGRTIRAEVEGFAPEQCWALVRPDLGAYASLQRAGQAQAPVALSEARTREQACTGACLRQMRA